MNKIIEVQQLVKKYDSFTAVNAISFHVNEGEIFGLLGPNGAGKTTTLEIIEIIISIISEVVEVCAFVLDKEPIKIKEVIGVQLQAAGYYPNLNLTQLIELFAGLYNKQIDAIELLNKVQLTEKAKAKYKELSGGQKQRFSIATTLINNPKVIFLDEPTTGLDPQARRNLWDLILSLRSTGTTIVLTTHYMDEAEVLCDRVAIVDAGVISKIDTPSNLIDQLLATGFQKPLPVKQASLEDVFINLTGKALRDE